MGIVSFILKLPSRMSGDMTGYIDRAWQAGNMCRMGFNVYLKRRSIALQSLRTDI